MARRARAAQVAAESQEPPVTIRRGLPRLERDTTAHDHVVDALGIAVRIFVRRGVGDTLGIEDDEIGPGADADLAAIGEPQMPRGERRHLAHRVFEGHDVLVARVAAQHARERAVRARMRLAERRRPIRCVRRRVAPDRDVRLRHDVAHVVLIHRVVDDLDVAVVLDERVTRPLEGILPRLAREIGDRATAVLGPPPSTRDDDAIPVAAGLGVLVTDARAHRRILQALAHRETPALVRPVRDRDGEPRRRGRVGILVSLDVEAGVPRGFDLCGRLLHAAPVLRPAAFLGQLHAYLKRRRSVLLPASEDVPSLRMWLA